MFAKTKNTPPPQKKKPPQNNPSPPHKTKQSKTKTKYNITLKFSTYPHFHSFFLLAWNNNLIMGTKKYIKFKSAHAHV